MRNYSPIGLEHRSALLPTREFEEYFRDKPLKPLWVVSTKPKPNDKVVNYKTEYGLNSIKLSAGDGF